MTLYKSLISLGVIFAIAGCSTEEQDIPDKTQAAMIVKGAVIDPFISSAVVFADYNEDDVLDPFEPWAFTDKNGYYSVGKEGENYCVSNKRYCLQLPSNDPVKLVAVGGYDLTTLERISSRMSRRYDGSSDVQYITPLTSVGDITLNEQQSIIQNQNIMVDAFASKDSAFGLAFTLHKMVELISRGIAQEYPAIGDNDDLPIDVAGYTYDAINELSKKEQLSLASLLKDMTDERITFLLTQVRKRLDAFIVKKNTGLTKAKAVQGAATTNNINQQVRAMIENMRQLHNALTTQLSKDLSESKFRVLAISGDNFIEQPLQDALKTHQILIDIALNETVLEELGKTSFDTDYFSRLNSVGDIDKGTLRMRARHQFPNDLTNMQLVLSDKSAKRDTLVGFFFEGQNSGNITACVKFKNLIKPSDSQNTEGTLLKGNWSKTNYVIDLTLTLAGTEEALRIKTTDNNSFVFDYDKNEKDWSTTTALSNISIDIPTTDQQCKDWIASL